jgi:hypothetical protein
MRGTTSKRRAVSPWDRPMLISPGWVGMAEKANKQIEEIEQTQEALRESIEQAKELAEKAQELLQNHKRTVEKRPPD